MNKLDAVIFDFDGVLSLNLDLYQKSYLEAYKNVGYVLDKQKLKDSMWMTAKERAKKIFGNDFTEELFKRMITKKDEMFFKLIDKSELIPKNTQNIIKNLSSKYRLAIVTSATKPEVEAQFSEYLQFFSTVIDAYDIKTPKPNPQCLLLAAERLGLEPSKCVYVGDAPTDMEAAVAAKMKAIGVTTGVNTEEELKKAGAYYVFKNLDEVGKYLISGGNYE